MRVVLHGLVGGLTLVMATGCGTHSKPNAEKPPPAQSEVKSTSNTPSPAASPGSAAIDKLLESSVSTIGGGFAVILIKDNRTVYRKAFGGYRIDQVVPVASSSKWLAGALVMALVDEGKLSLDDRVSKYLPEFAGDKAEVTIRQLFAHTSGLPAEIGCRNNRQTTLEACAKQIANVKLTAQPGTEFFYGGVSMQVGGRVLEVVGGESFNDLFVRKIALPLGMASTDFYAYGATDNPRPAGDARSTLDDYAKFLQMIVNGGEFNGRRILSAKAIEEMHRDHTGGSSIKYSIFWNKGHLDPTLPSARYGVGVWGEKIDPRSGKILMASSPGALGSYPWVDFENKVAGVIFTRGTFSRTLPVYLKLREAVRRMANKQ